MQVLEGEVTRRKFSRKKYEVSTEFGILRIEKLRDIFRSLAILRQWNVGGCDWFAV